ncbi:pyruvate, phosphate dikinase [candidate division KSB1 bacterium]|nr:MAG: pyruvate, phosphate dikinase [candidate division KSB1 bacterium]
MAKKYVYFFGDGKAEGNKDMKNLLGGKGANLAEMTNLNIPVPAGFTILTEVCTEYYKNNEKYPEGLIEQVKENLKKVEKCMNARFGDPTNPLLVSVRSGARVSMPGMMDTVLNIGLNDRSIKGLINQTKNEKFAYDSYRRFIQMYGDVVLGIEHNKFEKILEKARKRKNVRHEKDLDVEDLKEIVLEYKELVKKETGSPFPDDPEDQLWGAIGAVFKSWNNKRAINYRKINNIPDDWGTAVNVQAMVYGNMGNDSATGVAFTRDPATGESRFYGEFLLNAQGEDVVAGIRTPLPINLVSKKVDSELSLEEMMPEVYRELEGIRNKLEKHYKDLQDIEFTIQKGKLWMLQTRSGKRTGFAALRIAVEMVEEGLIDEKTAITRVEPQHIIHLLAPVFDPREKEKALKEGRFLAKGLNAGPGAASGKIVFNPDRAEILNGKGEKVILVRIETSPEDIHGMKAAEGILTSRGGMTSHAALVARGMGKSCVVGCSDLDINYDEKIVTVNNKILKEGDYISIDGTTGEVIDGKILTKDSEILQVLIKKTMKEEDSKIYQQFKKFFTWVDKYRTMKIRTNADTPEDASNALVFGAEGIGLCRTEHMFFDEDRIDTMREMILAENTEGRKKALSKLLPMQREDFIKIFRVMNGLPVTIRTLDPPLHEFLPHKDVEIEKLAQKTGVPFETLKSKVESLKEANPMLGHRGCRLGIVYPEITEMQAQAIFEAAVAVKKEGVKVIPEVMIPLVGDVKELKKQKEIVVRKAEEIMKRENEKIDYLVGTMIEIPRAALTADKIAEEAEFFSFGTNDLTQTTFGISRDDAAHFLPFYMREGLLKNDPFETLDFEGVGQLLKLGVERGRKTKNNLKIGICGEHGGDPETVKFCFRIGLNYVSCSPFRVPVARLAAAQENIVEK